MIDQSYRPADRRQSLRLAIDHRSNLRITLDGASSDGESIQGVTLTDISQGGLMASDAGQLVPGARVTLEVPLVGWREAEVVWIVENRAGCRFLQPLDLEELGRAAAQSERLLAEWPSFAGQIAELSTGPASVAGPIAEAPRSGHLHPWWIASIAAAAVSLLGFLVALMIFDLLG